MRKLAAALLMFCIMSGVSASEGQRPNPRVPTQTQTTAQNVTTRGQREAEAREQAAENLRINRSTASREIMTPQTPRQAAVPVRMSAPVSRAAAVQGVVATPARTNATTGPVRSVAQGNVNRSRAAATPVIAGGATRPTANAARAATTGNIMRAQQNAPGRVARSATGEVNTARSTALFTNTAAMGGEFNACRETYFACMDQFCGLANDTYRRCICSQRFREFRDREESFAVARQMILEFNDRNLDSIGLSAAESAARFGASEGELAMRRDTSASMQLLDSINDLLSGRANASSMTSSSANNRDRRSTGTLNLDFGGGSPFGSGGSIFDSGGGGGAFQSNIDQGVNMELLEGRELYDEVHRQCMEVATACRGNQAVTNMATSAYTVLITQDCNAYERHLTAQRQALESTIREANIMMMDARLEAFRENNSADFNQCLDRTRTAVMQPLACGTRWERCLDFTGQFVNTLNGEPILTPIFFQLAEQIDLSNHNAQTTREYLRGIDNFRNRAQSALDTCRNIADDVWGQFRQMAMIEIAQAQRRMIEEVRDSCIDTMTECYDRTSGQLRGFVEAGNVRPNAASGSIANNAEVSTVATTAGAHAHRATAAICQDRVLGCAALFNTNPNTRCEVANGRITNADSCGMAALMAFVNTVDDTRITFACRSDLEQYIQELCTPPQSNQTSGTTSVMRTAECEVQVTDPEATCTWDEMMRWENRLATDLNLLRRQYPYACRGMPFRGRGSVYEMLIQRALIVCLNPETGMFDETGWRAIQDITNTLEAGMHRLLSAECSASARSANTFALWIGDSPGSRETIILPSFVDTVFSNAPRATGSPGERFAGTLPANVRVQFGEAVQGATAPVVMQGRVVAMTLPARAPGSNAPVRLDSQVGEDLLAPRGWGACELISLSRRCEVMNNLAEGNEKFATYNEATRQCVFTPEYYQVVCERFLALPGTAGEGSVCTEQGPAGASCWNPQTRQCEFIRQQ